MKILFLNYEYPPLGGGAGNAVRYIFQEFAKRPDLKIDLVTSSVAGYRKEEIGKNIKVYFLNIGKNSRSLYFQSKWELLSYSSKSYFFAQKLIKSENYDLIHAFFGLPCGFIAKRLKRKYGTPYIVSLRGSDIPSYNERFQLLDKFFLKKMSREVWQEADIITALSHDSVEMARKTEPGKEEIQVIYNGGDTDQFRPDEKRKAKEETTNILFVGRMIERKGLIYLLKAFEELIGDYSFLRLFVVGEGPLLKRHKKYVREKKIEEKVVFFGKLDHEDLSAVYQRAHIFVLPSLNEALGNVTQEAIASGLPVIVTETGAAELVKDNGMVVKKASASELKRSITVYLKDPQKIKEHGCASRSMALGMSWGKTVDEYEKIYKDVFYRKIE